MPINSIQAQVTLWVYIICLAAIFLFISISYLITWVHQGPQYFRSGELPYLVITFSLFSALISQSVSYFFLKPFMQIKAIIETFSQSHHGLSALKSRSQVQELSDIETFIIDSLKVKSEKIRIEETFYKDALQVSHDIRSPLQALETISLNLRHNGRTSQIFIDSVKHINDIAENLLNKYRTKDLMPADDLACVDVCIQPLVKDIIDMNRDRLQQKNISLKATLKDIDQWLKASVNPTQFKQIISNMLNNAVEAMAEQGRGEIELSLVPTADQLMIRIEDTGRGIAKEKISKIFKEGYTMGKSGGCGMGLSHALSCLTVWGGVCYVESSSDMGTTFCIQLPLSANCVQTEIDVPRKKANDDAFNGFGRQYLLVEDDALTREVWKISADEHGINLSVFESAKEARQYIHDYEKECVIYIDSDLKDGTKGENLAKEFFELGYKNIYLSTGFPKESFSTMRWIKSVIDKRPPFSLTCVQ